MEKGNRRAHSRCPAVRGGRGNCERNPPSKRMNREPTACPSPRNFRTKIVTGTRRRVLVESIPYRARYIIHTPRACYFIIVEIKRDGKRYKITLLSRVPARESRQTRLVPRAISVVCVCVRLSATNKMVVYYNPHTHSPLYLCTPLCRVSLYKIL